MWALCKPTNLRSTLLVVHSAHSMNSYPVQTNHSALHRKIIHCSQCTLWCSLCKPVLYIVDTLHIAPRALHTCEFSVCANQPISTALQILMSELSVCAQQPTIILSTAMCTYVGSQTVQINRPLVYFLYIVQCAHCGSMEVSTRQVLQCVAWSFVCPAPV